MGRRSVLMTASVSRRGASQLLKIRLAIAGPFCTVMLDDGVRSAGAALRVADVATLLAEAAK
jgi:hypothetical protein